MKLFEMGHPEVGYSYGGFALNCLERPSKSSVFAIIFDGIIQKFFGRPIFCSKLPQESQLANKFRAALSQIRPIDPE